MVESWFKVRAYSRASAVGMWQFISSTGQRYGLSRDSWVDERFNPEKSTDAAIGYLTDLHGLFGDWPKALAGYNCGEARVQRLQRRSATEYLDFWDLYELLPRETRRYVPRLFAALQIIENPGKYGMTLPDPDDPPGELARVRIQRAVKPGDPRRAPLPREGDPRESEPRAALPGHAQARLRARRPGEPGADARREDRFDSRVAPPPDPVRDPSGQARPDALGDRPPLPDERPGHHADEQPPQREPDSRGPAPPHPRPGLGSGRSNLPDRRERGPHGETGRVARWDRSGLRDDGESPQEGQPPLLGHHPTRAEAFGWRRPRALLPPPAGRATAWPAATPSARSPTGTVWGSRSCFARTA